MSGYYFLFTPNISKTELPSTVMSVTPIADRELDSFAREPDPVKLVLRSTENLTTTNNSKLNDKKLGKSPKINTKISWQSVAVKPGDSLALIFSRLGLSSSSLFQIMSLGRETSILKTLIPGNKLKFHIVNNELLALKYEMGLTKILKVSKKGNEFIAEKINIKLDSIVKNANGTINDSLFLSGQKAGLSDNLIMRLVAIFGWDIDFALDIRKGDSFTILYEEQYKNGVKVAEGPIIAAEFINQGKAIRAIRYSENNERNDYYAANGDAMRKAFLRTPVDFFSRISSRFSLGRKHPVLNKIRAHKGVDYAAATGTPVRATGDGVIAFAGKNGGFGRTIKLKHGGTYSTVYAHLRRIAKNIHRGKKVKQGQIIGYVGQSGLATGPHLHYEFQIHGVHRNPLTVKLPKVKAIAKENMPEFKKTIVPILAELDRITGRSVISAQQSDPSNERKISAVGDG
jgi:murein DD-endopeptidase MepM/ murein hydrolase activator NlpD